MVTSTVGGTGGRTVVSARMLDSIADRGRRGANALLVVAAAVSALAMQQKRKRVVKVRIDILIPNPTYCA